MTALHTTDCTGVLLNNTDLLVPEWTGHVVPEIPMPEWSQFYAEQLARAGIETTKGLAA